MHLRMMKGIGRERVAKKDNHLVVDWMKRKKRMLLLKFHRCIASLLFPIKAIVEYAFHHVNGMANVDACIPCDLFNEPNWALQMANTAANQYSINEEIDYLQENSKAEECSKKILKMHRMTTSRWPECNFWGDKNTINNFSIRKMPCVQRQITIQWEI